MRAFAIGCVLIVLTGAALAESRRPVCGTIAQCDALIRTTPGIDAYERRGYLRLIQRRGLEDLEKAIEDFSAAIAIEARPFSLYARGMARLMSGDSAGQNEMEAARSVTRRGSASSRADGADVERTARWTALAV